MPGIAFVANEEKIILEKLVNELEVPGLTRLVIEERPKEISVYSSVWRGLTEEERGRAGREFRNTHIEKMSSCQRVMTVQGWTPHIFYAYTPLVVALPVSEDLTYDGLKKEMEDFILKQAQRMDETDPVNSYYVGELELQYRIPRQVLYGLTSCMPIAGETFLNRPAGELLYPRFTFTLSYYLAGDLK